MDERLEMNERNMNVKRNRLILNWLHRICGTARQTRAVRAHRWRWVAGGTTLAAASGARQRGASEGSGRCAPAPTAGNSPRLRSRSKSRAANELGSLSNNNIIQMRLISIFVSLTFGWLFYPVSGTWFSLVSLFSFYVICQNVERRFWNRYRQFNCLQMLKWPKLINFVNLK